MEIKFNKIKFKNFLCFGSREQEVELKNGLNIVVGIDKDNDDRSNGSGKTSLLETIPFALYGQTHKPVKKSDIVNWKNRRNCEVIIEFTKNNDEYIVLRSIKPNNLEIYKNGIIIDRPPHVRDYQKILDDIIGLNYQSFISIIHSNINSSMPITVMNKPEKRRFMEKIFNLKIYSAMNEKCNEKIRNINEKKVTAKKEIDFISTSIEIIKREILNLENRKNEYGKGKKLLLEKQKELNDLKNNNKKVKKICENLNTEIAEISVNAEKLSHLKQKIENNIKILSSKIKNLLSQISDIEREIEKSKEAKKYEEKLNYLIKKYGEIEDIENIIKKYGEKIQLNREKIEKLQIEKEDVNRVLITLQSQQNNLKNKISSLESHSICPLCEQKVKGDINIVENWKNDLFEIERHILECNEDLKNINKNIDNLNIKKYEEKIEKLQKVKDGISKLKVKIFEYNISKNKSTLKVLKFKIKKYKAAIDKLSKLMILTDKEYTTLYKTIDEKLKEKSEYEKIISEIEKLESSIDILKKEVEIEEKMKSDIDNQIEEKKKEKEEKEEKIKSIENQLVKNTTLIDYLSFIKELCKDENIKQFAISSNIPYINERVNYYLSEVGHNFYVVLDNWLDIQIKGPGITNGSYGSLSAGEAKSIDLAMQFAFLDVSRLQSGTFIDLLIEDEILDSSIDSIGLPKLINILKFKQREDNLKTFIISHRNEINDLDIDNIYQVIKKNGYSTVEIL